MSDYNIKQISQSFSTSFPKQRNTGKTIGREAEYPIVDSNGFGIDTFNILHQVYDRYGEYSIVYKDGYPIGIRTGDHAFYREVGKGTVEITTRPCHDLFEIELLHHEAISRLLSITDENEYRILGFGLQPRTKASPDFLTQEPHYKILYSIIPDIWNWFELTSSDQLHVSIEKDFLIPTYNAANATSFIVTALCGNSSIYDSSLAPAIAYRESHLQELLKDSSRHGPAPRIESLEALVSLISQRKHLFFSAAENYRIDGQPFTHSLDQADSFSPGLFREYLFHSHYNWNSARLRPATGTIEMRAACQLPPTFDGAASALYLGIVEGYQEIEDLLSNTSLNYKSEYLNTATKGMCQRGKLTSIISDTLGICKHRLQLRDRGEEQFLSPLEHVVKNELNPGQEAQNIYRDSGLDSFIEGYSWSEHELVSQIKSYKESASSHGN